MLNLPDVTLAIVDCVNIDRALNAFNKCKQHIQFGDSKFFTSVINGRVPYTKISPIYSKEAYSRFMIQELGKFIETSHVLVCQWDGYVVHPEIWDDEWLQYDYIGASWKFHPDHYRVGNGGFSLRSKKLLDVVMNEKNIVDVEPEDAAICRWYRPYLEMKYQIKYAPEKVADLFSNENSHFIHKTFGFHGTGTIR